ncbi:MAG: hypothetical protein JWL77_2558 [Chthonomonadaceae bacterium]|nr:hypothetical protein [Chthonomonadaceae bacterium]
MTVTADNPPTSSFQVRLLGGFEVRLGDGPLPPLRSRREQWLLALLVLRQDRDTARDWLAAALWPDNDAPQALFYLRKSLSNLRQALGTESARLLAPTPRTVRLNMTGAFADVVAFDRALEAADLQEAIALYRGPLLPDCLEEWAAAERIPREQAYLTALETLAAQFSAQGDPTAAVHWLRLLIAADPYRESAYGALMQALADCGDQAAVAIIYRELRSRLRQDLNAAPAPEIEALYRRLIRQERPTVVVETRPKPPPEMRRHLPVPLSDLIGREGEILEILHWMQRRRLVTLVGTGGIGKTRLSIAVAEAALPRFEQGVWFVDLAALTDAARVPHVTARALGITEEGDRPVMEILTEALESRSLLLVLDNCEHLADACATLAGSLLSACPALSILASSRQALNVMGEQVYRVPSLPVPPAELLGPDTSPDDQEKDPHFLMEYEAVGLFMDRAVRANSAFRLTRRNAPAVVEICRQLDGIPLAIEMAAARLRSLSVGEIRSRLEDRFRLLTGGNQGVLPRQQTLRAAIDWSYDQLAETERTLLRRLSAFAGGWTQEAAESVCGEELDVPDTLASLVDKSLVLRREGEDETFRYGMLETIRQYARERLEASAECAVVRRRHRDYFLTLAETLRPKLVGPERANAISVLETEHDNLRQALAFCREALEAGAQGLRLSAALWGFWRVRGHLREGRDHFAASLSHPGAQDRSKLRSDALNGAGVLAYFQGDFAAARVLHEEGLTLSREIGDSRGLANALANLGNVAATQGDYTYAQALYQESLEIKREQGDRHSVATTLNNLGNIAKEQGRYDAAHALHEESLAIERELGNRQGVASSLNNLGLLAEVRGDSAAARALYLESLELHRALGARSEEAGNLVGLGNVACREGDYLLARTLFEESLAIRKPLGDSWGIAISLQGLGASASLLGDSATALTQLQESLTIRQKLEDRLGMAETLRSLASLAHCTAHPDRAARLWGAMSALQDTIGSALSPNQQQEWQAELAAAREAIGEAAFTSVWEAGHTMTLDQAIAYALDQGLSA